ncbi:hypothetical protein [Streptomyces sp. NPDC008122]|uniref:hypothetical protein n=1 Tax=Streptomyces sp. NPDC008122 TaxID=3364810 RepID=UPI0036E6EF73
MSKFGSFADVCTDSPNAFLGTDETREERALDLADLAIRIASKTAASWVQSLVSLPVVTKASGRPWSSQAGESCWSEHLSPDSVRTCRRRPPAKAGEVEQVGCGDGDS